MRCGPPYRVEGLLSHVQRPCGQSRHHEFVWETWKKGTLSKCIEGCEAELGSRSQTIRSGKALWGLVRSVVSWSWFIPACKSWWLIFQEFCEIADAMSVSENQSWKGFLYHRISRCYRLGPFFFSSRELFVTLLQHTTGLCPKTTRHRLIPLELCLGWGALWTFAVMSPFYQPPLVLSSP